MKIHLTVYELWFWRIAVVVCLIGIWVNYIDNRKQDYLLFKTIDSQEKSVSNESMIVESLLKATTIDTQQSEINLEIIKRLDKLEAK